MPVDENPSRGSVCSSTVISNVNNYKESHHTCLWLSLRVTKVCIILFYYIWIMKTIFNCSTFFISLHNRFMNFIFHLTNFTTAIYHFICLCKLNIFIQCALFYFFFKTPLKLNRVLEIDGSWLICLFSI